MSIRIVKGAGLLDHTAALRSVHVDAFCAPPWNGDAQKAAEFAGRLPVNVRRPRLRHRLDHSRPLPHRPLLPAGRGEPRPRPHGGVAVRRTRDRRTRRLRTRHRRRGAPPGGGHRRRAGGPFLAAQASHPSPEGKGIVVFLGPRHPVRALVP
ncbi:LOW QUALITY PROTEIN: putative acetyltransferase, partial [Streptomyces himastatinicus ATCC 53653]